MPFNSETLVTGKLFEDIRDSVHDLADPALYDAIVIINLCVPTASGVPLKLLPKQINGVRVIGIDVPGFGVPTHAEAKDVLAGAMLRYARGEAEKGPVQAPRVPRANQRPTVTLLGEMFPADPMGIGALLDRWALPPAPLFRRASGASSMPRSTAPRSPPSIPSTPPASASSRPPAAGRRLRACRARRHRRLARRHRQGRRHRPRAHRRGAEPRPAADRRGAGARPHLRPHHALGYEGSELLVGRLLVESGADLRYVGTACPQTPWSEPDRAWLEARGVTVRYRASLEQDLEALDAHQPDLAIGTTPVVQKAKERAIPALYFTNLISARPLFGLAGPARSPPWSMRRSATSRASTG